MLCLFKFIVTILLVCVYTYSLTLQEDCNKALDWYIGVKETLGSVEVTSYGRMQDILTFGRYHVGVDRAQVLCLRAHDIHEVIRLRLDDRCKQLSKTYSLDELRDLESKLVLITGSKAENRRRVDQFLNVSESVSLLCIESFNCCYIEVAPILETIRYLCYPSTARICILHRSY